MPRKTVKKATSEQRATTTATSPFASEVRKLAKKQGWKIMKRGYFMIVSRQGALLFVFLRDDDYMLRPDALWWATMLQNHGLTVYDWGTPDWPTILDVLE